MFKTRARSGSDTESSIEKQFKMNGALTLEKLLEYLPTMIITNLSTLLLVSIDGLVAGNLVGKDALSSVNLFYPISLVIGAISALIACGSSSCLSTVIGMQEPEALRQMKSSVRLLEILSAVFVGIAQIPFTALLISSYQLSPEMHQMT